MTLRKDTYENNYRFERSHWWFRGRRRIIDYLGTLFIWKHPQGRKILAIGCGTGAELEFLSKLGDVTGVDYSQDAVDYCKKNNAINVLQGDATCLPFQDDTFDLVVAFDVLEHIKDDKKAVSDIFRVLKPEGYLYVTVPAFQFLWSYNDDISHHMRRYTKASLLKLLKSHPSDLIKVSYFNTILFPLVFVIRKAHMLLGSKSVNDGDIKETGKVVNTILTNIFALEKYLLRFANLPFGVSLLCILRKKK